MSNGGTRWLEGDAALITGGGSGLGRALVHRFVTEGARVVAFDSAADKVRALEDQSRDVVAVAGDVRSLADNERAVQVALDSFGKLDVLVANAGIWDYQRGLLDLPAESIDAAFDEVFHVNVKGYLLAARAAVDALRRTGGSIVLTLSNAAFYPAGGGPLYTASKHAALGLLRQLAYELAPEVRVNGVAPGAMATSLRGPAALGQESERLATRMAEWDTTVRAVLPLQILPTVDDMTAAYVLLSSRSASRATTGSVIHCDGGIGVRGIFGTSRRQVVREPSADHGSKAALGGRGEEESG